MTPDTVSMTIPLSARRLSMSFGSKRVLDGLDLTVQRGEIVALLGANGAGKTTLLSILTGLQRPTAGEMRVYGEDPHGRHARAGFGVMLQDNELPPGFRIGELIELFRRLYPRPLPMATILRLARLEGMQAALVGKLSGGQKQRLKFALAVAGDPPLLFLDEPTVAMDAESRRQFLAALRERVALGRSIVLTTHQLDDIDAVAHRIAVLHGGRIVGEGSPAQIKATLGGKLLQFRSPGVSAERLGAIRSVSQVSREADLWCLHTQQAEDSLRELLEVVTDVSDLTVRSHGLEQALAAMTAAVDTRGDRMSPPARPTGEYPGAQHEGSPIDSAARPGGD